MSTAAGIDQETSLFLLLFSLGAATFGIDTEQVAGIGVCHGEETGDLVWLHQALGYDQPPPYRQPMAVLIKGGGKAGSPPFRLMVEAPQDIREFGWRDIRPFPPLLEPFTLPRGLWGVLPLAGELILLLDCHRLTSGGVSLQRGDVA